MRNMACVWFTVVVLIGVQKVFGNVCVKKDISSFNCDECIRCGGKWCTETGNVGCNREPEDSWCPYHQESPFQIRQVDNPGDLITPIYAERSVLVDGTSTIELTYKSKTRLEVKIEILNSTQSRNFRIREEDAMIRCTDMSCTTSIEASPKYTFCSESGTNQEFVYAKVTIGNFSQPALIKYHVACACECSKNVGLTNLCSGHGNYSCGCKCEDGWKGDRCDQEDCPERGDAIPSCKSSINGLDCSGNGYCDHCNICHCNMSLEGSQYFEQELCGDLCMTVSECSDCTDCIYNSTVSQCDVAPLPGYVNFMNVVSKNESLLNETDSKNRKKWVKCSMVVKDCNIKYMAKKEADGGEVYVMVMESCNDKNTGAYTAAPTVSIVLGVLAAVAALVAVAGVMIYKHMNALPPVPLNGVGYTDIDAVDCVGQNPLYKSPTSNFNNPTYGKW